MAVRPATRTDAGNRKTWLVAATLLVLFVAALFLRAYWNVDAARTEDGTFVLSGGSDPYYHKRAIDAIQANGFQTLYEDPMLNYPYGAVNPNPPIYEWSVAVAGKLMEPFFSPEGQYTAVEVSTWWATEWSPAIYGALTVFPIYFLAAALFDRRVGVVAALFWTISTSAIDATGLGLADHDAAIMFFTSLAFLFYVKALQQFRGDANWVRRWSDGTAVSSGLGRFFRERRAGLGYSLLTAVSIGAVALVWKGFPYVIGIMFVYAGLQMVLDHWRNRDSTGVFVGTFLAMLLGTLMAYPYYASAGVANFLTPVWYIVGGFFVAGLVLVPTRDLPTILVMPAALVAAILGIVVAFFVLPEVAQSLLYSTVYFKRTSIYETIAEAHPADFSTITFGIGPVPFFLALAGWFMLAFTIRRHAGRPILFALVWGAIAVFMAQSAVRFLFNAIPVFALFAAFTTIWLIDWLDFAAIRKSLAANQGNFWQGLRKGTRAAHVVFVILVVLLFVLPNGLLAADAALPPSVEQQKADASESEFIKNFYTKRLGAYGQGFIPDYWQESLSWLSEHDANITNPAERPAFLSWWDYGHWAIAVGEHPAVADNFQNGYVMAANFLLSQNETHAIQLMAGRLMGELSQSEQERILAEAGAEDAAAAREALQSHEHVASLDLAESADLLAKVEAATGKKIRYFATDIRMLPYDDPRTPSIEQSSIYYAPVRLAERDPDDYVATLIDVGSGTPITTEEYEQLARNPIQQVAATSERLAYKQPFFGSMYYRGFLGTPVGEVPEQGVDGNTLAAALNNARPGFGLEHFRVVYSDDAVRILEYTPGAIVEGVLTEEGAPIAGATVTAFDDASRILLEGVPEEDLQGQPRTDYDIPHASVTTDADGRYRLVAPFATEGGVVRIVANRDGVTLGEASLAITREAAAAGETFSGVDIDVQRGSVEGAVYIDENGDGTRNETDMPAANLTVRIGGRNATTDAEGKFRIEGISAGTQSVNVTSDQYQPTPATASVRVQPGETVNHTVLLQQKPAAIAATAYFDANDNQASDEGETVSFALVDFAPTANSTGVAKTLTIDSSGNLTGELMPGEYAVTGTYNAPDGAAFELEQTVTVEAGAANAFTFRYTRSAVE